MLYQALAPVMNKRSATQISSGGFFGLFGATTKSGVAVTSNSALTLSAFYNGIVILCNDYAKMPKAVYKNTDGNREKRRDHPISYLIHHRPNQYMTAFMFDSMMLQYAILKGNAYAEIQRDQYSGQPISFQLIDQEKNPVVVKLSNEKLFYHFDNRMVAAENMLHVPGFSFNGITGIGVVAHAANALGISLSSVEFAADYYKTKGVGTAVVTTAKQMDGDAKSRYSSALSKSLNANKGFKVAVIDEMASFQHIKLTPQETQFLETNKAGVIEVARFLNIPPHKLKSLDNANYSNMESQNIQHVSDSIIPWSIKFKQEYDYKLFSKAEFHSGFYINHNSGILLQADKKTQGEYLTKLVYSGILTRNEARAYLEHNKIDGLGEPLTPVNMQTLEQIEKLLKTE